MINIIMVNNKSKRILRDLHFLWLYYYHLFSGVAPVTQSYSGIIGISIEYSTQCWTEIIFSRDELFLPGILGGDLSIDHNCYGKLA